MKWMKTINETAVCHFKKLMRNLLFEVLWYIEGVWKNELFSVTIEYWYIYCFHRNKQVTVNQSFFSCPLNYVFCLYQVKSLCISCKYWILVTLQINVCTVNNVWYIKKKWPEIKKTGLQPVLFVKYFLA